MALFEEQDFQGQFFDDFGRDADMIIDRINGTLEGLARDYGDPFRLIAEQIADVRLDIVDSICAVLVAEVLDKRMRLDDVLNDVIDAVFMKMAREIMDKDQSIGSGETYDFILDQFDSNPYLAESRGRGRSRGRDDRNSRGRGRDDRGRSSGRGRDVGGRASTRGRDRSRGNGYESKRADAPTRGRGRLVPESQKRQQAQREEVQHNTPVVHSNTIENGTVITSANRADTGVMFAPLYIVGEEQTEFMDGDLVVTDYTGKSEVDYEKHRVDLLFTNIIGAGAATTSNTLTENAIRRAEEAIDRKISGFVKNPDNEEEQVIDSKFFQHAKSTHYGTIQQQFTLNFDPIDVRDNILDAHGGDYAWFRDNAMIVDVDQYVDFGNSNDALLQVQALLKTTNYMEVVKSLIQLSGVIDAARWKFLHDFITRNLNIIMLRYARLGQRVDSITGDWADLAAFLKTVDESKRTLMMANFSKLLVNLEALREDERNFLKVRHSVVYLPLTSFECELASASVKSGIVRIDKNTKIYNLVAKLFNDDTYGSLSFVTLDGLKFELLMSEEITNREFDIVLF